MSRSKNFPTYTKIAPALEDLVKSVRIVIFAGLPGVGKSLLVKRLARLAISAGRKVTNIQWDVARDPFETPKWIERYPEVGGVTNPFIRRAVGIWARDAICKWDKLGGAGLLICEAPVIGNRFGELTRVQRDPSERVLKHRQTVFVIPVPSVRIRRTIERARARTRAAPKNLYESKDASVEVIHKLWLQVAQVSIKDQLVGKVEAKKGRSMLYDPEIYAAAYQNILRHRNVVRVNIDEEINDRESVYELDMSVQRLMATESEAEQLMAEVACKWVPEALEHDANEWFMC